MLRRLEETFKQVAERVLESEQGNKTAEKVMIEDRGGQL